MAPTKTFPVDRIGLAGLVASGKGTISKLLVQELRWPLRSSGEAARQIQREQGAMDMDIDQFVASRPGLDFEIDKANREFVLNNSPCIFEARLVPQAIEGLPTARGILLYCDDVIRFAREANRRKEKGASCTFDEACHWVHERDKRDQERYQKLYGIPNIVDPLLFDFAIDTGKHHSSECVRRILEFIQYQPHSV